MALKRYPLRLELCQPLLAAAVWCTQGAESTAVCVGLLAVCVGQLGATVAGATCQVVQPDLGTPCRYMKQLAGTHQGCAR